MNFYELLDHIQELLRRHRWVSSHALKEEFQLADDGMSLNAAPCIIRPHNDQLNRVFTARGEVFMDRSYATENTGERQRLGTLIASVSDDDLKRRLPNGWTVAITLAHLAFWDRQRLALLKRWEREGVQPAPADADTINEAVRALAAALPPRTATQLALDAAEAIDQALEQLSADLVAKIEAGGEARLLRRAVHRREHLDRIEQALRAKPAGE